MSSPSSAPRRIRIAALDAWDVPGDVGGATILLLHGYGADANDLLPLHRAVRTPPGTRWVVPDAPLSMGISQLFGGRAWFHLDQEAIERAIASGTHRDRSDLTPPGLDDAREAVLRVVAALDTPLDKVVLAGFSQGAMVATEVALTLPLNVAGLLLFSNTLLHADIWRRLAQGHAGLPFMQSHGLYDPLLGIEMARKLRDLLKEAGLVGELHEFAGQHELPMPILKQAERWLGGILAPKG